MTDRNMTALEIDSTERYYANMESDRNTAEASYFDARPLLDREGAPVETFRAGLERAYKMLWNDLQAARRETDRACQEYRELNAKVTRPVASALPKNTPPQCIHGKEPHERCIPCERDAVAGKYWLKYTGSARETPAEPTAEMIQHGIWAWERNERATTAEDVRAIYVAMRRMELRSGEPT